MEIIKTSTQATPVISTISVPSRLLISGSTVAMTIHDEQDNSISTVAITPTYLNGYLTFDYDFVSLINKYYYIILVSTVTIEAIVVTRELCKFKIFCTDDAKDYKISTNKYVDYDQSNNPTNNEFVTLDDDYTPA